MADSYVNPSAQGGWIAPHGDRPSPKAPSGVKKGQYDNAAPSTASPQADDKASPGSKGVSKAGYDNVGKDLDFGFSGTPKKRSPNI